MVYFIQSYIIVLIETICCIIFCEIFRNIELNKNAVWLSRWMIVVYLSTLTCVTTIVFEFNMIIKQIAVILLYALFNLLYRKWKFGKCIAVSTIFQSILLIADFMTILIKKSLLETGTKENDLENFVIIVLSKLILFLLVLGINNMFRKNDTVYIKENEWLIFFILPFFSMMILIAIAKNAEFVTNVKLEQFFWILSIGLVCMNILMFYFMQSIGKRGYLLKEKALLELETRNQMHLYKTITENVQEQRRISHEYKNQLTCIQALCKTKEYDELMQYLERINEDVLHDLDYIDTNHVLVNSVLNVKYEEAMANDILFICKINDLSGLTMDSSELVVLLSNLLNNAIEACKKCNGKRVLKMKCIYEAGDFILYVKNSYDGKIKVVDHKLYTTKKTNKESHGIGLKNVMQIVKKNEGYYAMNHTDTEFYISIVIPQGTHE